MRFSLVQHTECYAQRHSWYAALVIVRMLGGDRSRVASRTQKSTNRRKWDKRELHNGRRRRHGCWYNRAESPINVVVEYGRLKMSGWIGEEWCTVHVRDEAVSFKGNTGIQIMVWRSFAMRVVKLLSVRMLIPSCASILRAPGGLLKESNAVLSWCLFERSLSLPVNLARLVDRSKGQRPWFAVGNIRRDGPAIRPGFRR